MSTIRTAVPHARVSIRRTLARRPWIHWLAVVATAIALAASVHDAVSRVHATRRSWGVTTSVVVASGDIEPGQPIEFVRRDVPLALAPDASLDSTDGLVARQHIGDGEIVTAIDVVGQGPLALVPEGWMAAPIVESPRSGAAVGDRVQVATDGFVLSADALVVGHVGDVTLVAVPADEAPLVPAAADAGSLTLLLRP